jgi:hypothetical protein
MNQTKRSVQAFGRSSRSQRWIDVHGAACETPSQPWISRTPLASQQSERFFRIRATCCAPVGKFGNVDTPFANLAFMHKDVAYPQLFAQLPLGQAGFLAEFPEQAGNQAVARSVLGFGHGRHFASHFACYRLDNRLSCAIRGSDGLCQDAPRLGRKSHFNISRKRRVVMTLLRETSNLIIWRENYGKNHRPASDVPAGDHRGRHYLDLRLSMARSAATS